MKTNLLKFTAIALGVLAMSSCVGDGEDTIVLEEGNSSDIPSDKLASPNPSVTTNNVVIPNIQYSYVDENGMGVFRIDMTGIQDQTTLDWLRLLGTGEKNQNVWVEVDGTPKGIKVYNTADDESSTPVPVDLVFLVDNSGSMSEEADAIARDIYGWAEMLNVSLDIQFGCVGYDGAITGACGMCDADKLGAYLNQTGRTGTSRTKGFEGVDYTNIASYKTGGGDRNECGMAALRFADENFTFRRGANRIYVNFTDEPNQPNGNKRFSVESLLTDWDTARGTIHTVFSDGRESGSEYNYLMSQYTGGTVINTNSSFSGVTLSSLPVTDAMRNSYIIRLTNISAYMDGKPHEVKITILSPDGSVQAERTFTVVFGTAE